MLAFPHSTRNTGTIPEPTGPEPTGPEPTSPEPTGPEPTGPEPTGTASPAINCLVTVFSPALIRVLNPHHNGFVENLKLPERAETVLAFAGNSRYKRRFFRDPVKPLLTPPLTPRSRPGDQPATRTAMAIPGYLQYQKAKQKEGERSCIKSRRSTRLLKKA